MHGATGAAGLQLGSACAPNTLLESSEELKLMCMLPAPLGPDRLGKENFSEPAPSAESVESKAEVLNRPCSFSSRPVCELELPTAGRDEAESKLTHRTTFGLLHRAAKLPACAVKLNACTSMSEPSATTNTPKARTHPHHPHVPPPHTPPPRAPQPPHPPPALPS